MSCGFVGLVQMVVVLHHMKGASTLKCIQIVVGEHLRGINNLLPMKNWILLEVLWHFYDYDSMWPKLKEWDGWQIKKTLLRKKLRKNLGRIHIFSKCVKLSTGSHLVPVTSHSSWILSTWPAGKERWWSRPRQQQKRRVCAGHLLHLHYHWMWKRSILTYVPLKVFHAVPTYM